jgi:hypothetical protein
MCDWLSGGGPARLIGTIRACRAGIASLERQVSRSPSLRPPALGLTHFVDLVGSHTSVTTETAIVAKPPEEANHGQGHGHHHH